MKPTKTFLELNTFQKITLCALLDGILNNTTFDKVENKYITRLSLEFEMHEISDVEVIRKKLFSQI